VTVDNAEELNYDIELKNYNITSVFYHDS
jgi:hypothetical protein